MKETFPRKIENRLEELPPEPKPETIPSKVEEFFDKEAEILGAYGLRGDIALERGNSGWAFDFQNRKLVYDPNFFVERGYNLQETLFATTHELMAHYGELLRDPELILKEARRYSTKPHLHLLYNIFEDVLGNRRIVAELPFLEETRTKLYKEKMFPPTDYRDKASHVQFAYGFIREMMVRGEGVKLDEKARTALEKLREFGEDKIDILDLVTTPTIDPKDRFRIMRNIIEPIYLELYKEDVEKGKKGEGKEGQGTGQQKSSESQQGQGGETSEKWWQKISKKITGEQSKESKGSPGQGQKEREAERKMREQVEKKFKEQYKDYEASHPEPLSPKDEKQIQKTLEEAVARQGGKPSLDKNILEEWAREHGVSSEDVLGYREEYKEIAPLVAELREVFKKIISRRLKERSRLSPQLEEKGEELEEGVLAEAYAESKAGGKPRVFQEIERKVKEQEGYGNLDMTLINDLSGSMNEGSKLSMDRKSKLLFLESLADFQKEIKEAEYESGVSLGLEVKTETRAFGDFGDAELKPLSPELSEQQRISIWKKLHRGDGGTPDYLSLEEVLNSITPEDEKNLREKSRRKVVVVLSDGGSADQQRYNKVFNELKKRGVIMVDLGMLTSERPGAEIIEDINKLPATVQKVILKYTQDL